MNADDLLPKTLTVLPSRHREQWGTPPSGEGLFVQPWSKGTWRLTLSVPASGLVGSVRLGRGYHPLHYLEKAVELALAQLALQETLGENDPRTRPYSSPAREMVSGWSTEELVSSIDAVRRGPDRKSEEISLKTMKRAVRLFPETSGLDAFLDMARKAYAEAAHHQPCAELLSVASFENYRGDRRTFRSITRHIRSCPDCTAEGEDAVKNIPLPTVLPGDNPSDLVMTKTCQEDLKKLCVRTMAELAKSDPLSFHSRGPEIIPVREAAIRASHSATGQGVRKGP